ncbi:hypothetical protein [Natrialba swarupiae]|uniref:hypothetical protein n=1 Tax=Natrialba swarupiae TaxID=2448032 RepID=UPI001391A10A|nr:hypothetical protein [Natrialba swarupiae]
MRPIEPAIAMKAQARVDIDSLSRSGFAIDGTDGYAMDAQNSSRCQRVLGRELDSGTV